MVFDIDALLAGGETFTVEFKRGSLSDSELVEAVTCLANGDGGVLLLGVEDDGRVSGAAPRTDPAQVAGWVQNQDRAGPPRRRHHRCPGTRRDLPRRNGGPEPRL